MVAAAGAVELVRVGSGVEVFRPQGEALTAAAKRIDFSSKDEAARYKRRQKGWQDEAWRYYDECGEAWFAANFVANCLRKVRLFAAEQPDKSQPPVPLDPQAAPSGSSAAAAIDLVERLHSADGGMGSLMAGFGLNLSVPGECILVCREDPSSGSESWKVHSSDEVFINSRGQWAVRGTPSDRKGVVLDPDYSIAFRIWRQHPHWSDQADSPMRPLLDVIEELLILSRAIRAAGRSRLAGAGMLLWPSEANLGGSPDPTKQGTAGQAVDPVLADLMTAMMTPIADEGIAAAVVPLLTKLPGERIAQVKHLLFERPIDPQLAAQRVELIRRFANGVDVPAQVILGIEDVNHWTGWMIDEQTFKSHLEPLVIQLCGSLTSEYMRSALSPADAGDYLVWFDPSNLIGHPNRAQDTKDAHDRFLLSDAAGRRYLGFADDDAPTPEEIEARVARKSIEKIGVLRAGEVLGETTTVSAREATQPGIPATGPDAGNTTPAVAASARLALPRAALTAASRRRALGMTLARRDRDLRLRLIGAADAAMFRALERAGATLRRRANRDPSVKAMLEQVENAEVFARLGPEAVLSYGVDTQEALDDAFHSFGMRFDRETQQAQQRLREQFDSLDEADMLDMDLLATQQSDSRRAAGALLLGALSALATQRLFDPHPAAPPLGEHDSELIVPPGFVREALAIAGGSPAPAQLDGRLDQAQGGVLTGELAVDTWNQLGIGPAGYEWFCGAPERPFEPHQDLEGVTFDSFDDDQLGADSSEFPFVDHYFPGDHDGCQCDFAPIMESS